MPRADLLALSPDDLATLANRGLIKRAQAELDAGELDYTLSENKTGTVSVLWSDDIHCLLPANVPLQEARCSCPATSLCRHLLRSVLAYQREHAEAAPAPEPTAPSAPTDEAAPAATTPEATTPPVVEAPTSPAPAAWNPGAISDETLAQLLPAPVLAKARKTWDAGHVIEVTRAARPSALFHTLAANLRFLVPHDARYTHCDCADAPPCSHVPLAVWAFRALLEGQESGLVMTRTAPLAVPEVVLDELEAALRDLASEGVSGAPPALLDRLTRLEARCRQEGLVWPAEILHDLGQQLAWHAAHNARFEPLRVAHLCGELLLRADAIRSAPSDVPQPFVRGTSHDKVVEVGASRLIGIGTEARAYKGGVTLSAFLQDSDSGAIVRLTHDYPDPTADPNTALRAGQVPIPKQLWELGRAPVAKGAGLGAIGAGQLLARGGKRAPGGELSFGRTPVSLNHQSFAWEKLRAPLLVENFAELQARFDALLPSALRPRRAGENVHVLPIAGVSWVQFAQAEQEARALLRDASGNAVLLVHPFTARGSEGMDALLAALHAAHTQPDSTALRFVAGRVQRGAGGLIISPFAVVLEEDKIRRMIQPWLERAPAAQATASPTNARPSSLASHESDPLTDYIAQLQVALGELFLVGIRRSDARLARAWDDLAQRATALGFAHLAQDLATLSDALTRKTKTRDNSPDEALSPLLSLTVTARLAIEMV